MEWNGMESRTVEINVTEQKCDHILSTYMLIISHLTNTTKGYVLLKKSIKYGPKYNHLCHK
jgi:hypothetical protein